MAVDLAVPLLLVVATACYLQTQIGFGFGLVVISGAMLLDLATIEFSAALVSFASLFNVLITLEGNWQKVDWSQGGWLAIGLVPGVMCGVLLLNFLSQHYVEVLEVILGTLVLITALHNQRKLAPITCKTVAWMPLSAGFLGGLGGGMFTTSSPPIVYYLYKINLDFECVKNTLLYIFLVSTVTRIGFITFRGDITPDLLFTVLAALPLIAIVTIVSKKVVLPFDQEVMRKLSFWVLALMGVVLVINGLSSHL